MKLYLRVRPEETSLRELAGRPSSNRIGLSRLETTSQPVKPVSLGVPRSCGDLFQDKQHVFLLTCKNLRADQI